MSLSFIREKLSHLPVNNILDDIVAHAQPGTVTIVNSETGSGKSLLVPSQLALMYPNRSIALLEPMRMIATNLSETLAEISETILGEDIGYMVGRRGQEKSLYKHDTKIVVMTHGVALATEAILDADIVIIDECHEQQLDMTICKALLHRRLTDGDYVTVVLMSATMDVASELDYWSGFDAKAFHTEGQSFPCDVRHLPTESVMEGILNLIDEGHKGILVFLQGVEDLNTWSDQLKAVMERRLENDSDTQMPIISIVHGQSDLNDRHNASIAPPDGKVKVLFGTNVIESGINFPWVSAGVSNGIGKELSVNQNTGAVALTPINLPAWRIKQQLGRTNRFGPGTFILCSTVPYSSRPVQTTAEIVRLPLTELVMHCATFGIHCNELKFHPQPKQEKLNAAMTQLAQYGFIDERCHLTEIGDFVKHLPVGVRSRAILYEAFKLGILAEIIPLVAAYEAGGVRKTFKVDHGFDRKSDLIDETMALCYAQTIVAQKLPRVQQTEMFERRNVGYKKYRDAYDIEANLNRHFNLVSNTDFYLPNNNDRFNPLFRQIKACILAGFIDDIYWCGFNGITVYDTFGAVQNAYQFTNSTAIYRDNEKYCAAVTRTIIPKNFPNTPLTFAETITLLTLEDLEDFSKRHPNVISFDNGLIRIHKRTISKDMPAVNMMTRADLSLGEILSEMIASSRPRATEHRVVPIEGIESRQALLQASALDRTEDILSASSSQSLFVSPAAGNVFLRDLKESLEEEHCTIEATESLVREAYDDTIADEPPAIVKRKPKAVKQPTTKVVTSDAAASLAAAWGCAVRKNR